MGVLLFVIPGVVAFAIDFASGAIYLPGGKAEDTSMRVVQVALDHGPEGNPGIEELHDEHIDDGHLACLSCHIFDSETFIDEGYPSGDDD